LHHTIFGVGDAFLRHTHIVPPGYQAVPLEIFGEPVGKRVVDLKELVKKCGRWKYAFLHEALKPEESFR
jgi:hypothetical protein